MLVIVLGRMPRVSRVAAQLVVAPTLLAGQRRGGFEMDPEMNGTKLTLKGRDPSHSRPKIRLIDTPGPELAFQALFLPKNLTTQALRTLIHAVKQHLYRPQLGFHERYLTISRSTDIIPDS